MAQGTTSGNSTGHRVDRMTGFTTKVGTPVVEVLEVDANRDVLLARGATVPTDADAGYAKGCKFIKTDGGVATTVYLNEGSATSADFNAVESSASTVTSVAAGNGLTGGGTEGALTLTVGAGTGITVNADDVALAATVAGAGLTHTAGVLDVVAGEGIVVNANDVALVSTVAGAGLTFTAGVVAVGAGTGITVNADDVQIADGGVDTLQLAADAVDGTKLADDAVSLEHLDAGITPSHIVVAAGKFTTAGGDATEVITATGAVATDLAFVSVESGNSGPVITAVPGTDNITVLLTADPGNDDVLAWQILRAAS